MAAEVAATVARKHNAEIYVLHAIQIPVYEDNARYSDYQSIPEGLYFLKLAKKKFDEFLSRDFFQGLKVVEALQVESTYESIVEKAKEHEIDLIVMGSKGAGGIKEVFVGSNTEKIIRRSECPVLTIKSSKQFHAANVVLVSEFNEEMEHVFFKCHDIFSPFNPSYHLLQVITPRNFESTNHTLERMKKFKETVNLDKVEFHIQNAGSVEEGVLEFHARMPMDVAVFGTHGRTGISHLIFGSVTEDVANHADFPVLSIRM